MGARRAKSRQIHPLAGSRGAGRLLLGGVSLRGIGRDRRKWSSGPIVITQKRPAGGVPMVRRELVSLFACGLVMGAVSTAVAGLPYLPNCSAVTAAGTPVSVYCTPMAGMGRTLLQATNSAGEVTDATITVTLRDRNGNPASHYPKKNLWLVSDGFVTCPLTPCCADGDTDHLGVTTFTGEHLGRGCSDAMMTVVMIDGEPLSAFPLAIRFISSDINGDNVVNALDYGIFVQALHGISYEPWRSNFHFDGAIDALDFGLFVAALKAGPQGCP